MARLLSKLRRMHWVANGRFGRTVSLDAAKPVTVLITYYDPARMSDIEAQVRNLLQCTFVERVVVSNHNPQIRIEDRLRIQDRRVLCINQSGPRPCGFRWHVLKDLPGKYFVVIDDDIQLYPTQLRTLVRNLYAAADAPHGLSGFVRVGNDQLVYHERQNMTVQYLCEVYALTRSHVERYFEMVDMLGQRDGSLIDLIYRYHDFIVISQAGTRDPQIHRVGRIYRNPSFKAPEVALHRDRGWVASVAQVYQAVDEICSLSPDHGKS